MPRLDGTGPTGTGPIGRGLGPCGGGYAGGYTGRGRGRGFFRGNFGWRKGQPDATQPDVREELEQRKSSLETQLSLVNQQLQNLFKE